MRLRVDRSNNGFWRAEFDNPPFNLMDPELFGELLDLVMDEKTAKDARVIVFTSVVPDFFVAHLDTRRATEPVPGYGNQSILDLWGEFVDCLVNAPYLSVASIHGRARGIGSEFILACDVRFAALETAIFAQPEVGASVVPGGGGLDWLPRLCGRSRALEIVMGAQDFDARMADHYGWINRAIPAVELDQFVDDFASRVALWDPNALRTAKAYINTRSHPADKGEIQQALSSIGAIWQKPAGKKRIADMDARGNNVASEFELNQPAVFAEIARADAAQKAKS